MKVLIACERSGAVRSAFRKRGHDAWSCDLAPAEDNSPFHYQMDIRKLPPQTWDLMIAFPDCTYLASSGLHWNKRVPGRTAKTDEAIKFVRLLLNAPVAKIALENPIGCISSKIRKPDQIIQPWQFGHDESKSTCLWLKDLPLLQPSNNVKRPAWVRCADGCDDFFCQRHRVHTADCTCPEIDDWVARDDDPYRERYANQTPSGQNKLGLSPTRAIERARTYLGIAEAMATQWG